MKNFIRISYLIVAFLVVVIASASIVFSGLYHVGATDRHIQSLEWLLRTTMENSIRYHARDIQVPDTLNLQDVTFARQFYGHYSAACQSCHGAPGLKAAPWMVIYPEAPDLTRKEVVDQWTDGELFWILKHGIKDTGMMALGPTHPEEAIWGVTALVRQLPEMSAEEYQSIARWYQEMVTQKAQAAEPSNMENHVH
uniref:Cytochrome c n=1 Tax=Roseihalotalea indica TaxID=2867963 RepID=A0AA49GQF5_9BACT|nr:cytochrome c [Tunicatimonas sp. TK19036]